MKKKHVLSVACVVLLFANNSSASWGRLIARGAVKSLGGYSLLKFIEGMGEDANNQVLERCSWWIWNVGKECKVMGKEFGRASGETWRGSKVQQKYENCKKRCVSFGQRIKNKKSKKSGSFLSTSTPE